MGMRKWVAGLLHAAGDKLGEAHGRPTASPFRTDGNKETPNIGYNYPCGGPENCREKREKTMSGNAIEVSPEIMKTIEAMAKKQKKTPRYVVAKGIQIEQWMIEKISKGGKFILEINGERRDVDFSI